MAGLSSLLNIAKVGLLTHQMNLQTTGHNVANVNTDGYSRQNVTLTPANPTPSEIGPIGNGVAATNIIQDFDQFITKTLFDKTSVMSGLETRQSGMKLIEGVLNEVDENGLNQVLNSFWAAWDEIANYAEGTAERTTLLQTASLLVEGLHDRYDTLLKLSQDINLNIQTSVEDINQAADQIAELNTLIVSMESDRFKANDLRDQRNEILSRLSELADVHYFETQRGTYTVLIGQGSPLVEGDRSWGLEVRSGQVYWKGGNGQLQRLTTSDVTQGELGGWMAIKERIAPLDTSILTGSVANTCGGRPVTMTTEWSHVDGVTVSGPFTIQFSGTDQNGLPVTGLYDSTVDYDGNGAAGTFGDLLNVMEAAFGGSVQARMDDQGRLQLRDENPGDFPISLRIEAVNGGVTGLDLGTFGDYPLNYLEQLNSWGEELIRAVNFQHSQGAGLVPVTGVIADNAVTDVNQPVSWLASGLRFSGDVQDGELQIWLYDALGGVIDLDPAGTPLVNEPLRIQITENVTTLADIAAAINGVPGLGLSAGTPGGRLVVSVDGTNPAVAGFAFGGDTSGALMALGVNTFFSGHDAATIALGQAVSQDLRLIAAAEMESPGHADVTGAEAVRDPSQPLTLAVQDGSLSVHLYHPLGYLVREADIPIVATETSLEDVLRSINSVEGMSTVMDEGHVRIEATEPGWTFTLDNDTAGLLNFLWETAPAFPAESVSSDYAADRAFEPFSSSWNTLSDGDLRIRLFSSAGHADVSVPVTIGSLQEIASQIDAVDGLTAEVMDGKLHIGADGGTEALAFLDDSTGLLDFLGLATPAGGSLNPANNLNALAMHELARIPVTGLDDATLNEAFSGLVGTVGIHSRGFQLDYEFSRATVNELTARRDEVSGVSLDEEMAKLIKFQHAYTAAAKLIKTADEMFLSLLETK